MAISSLLKSITPDEQMTWTLERFLKEFEGYEGFDFKGPGWYSAKGSWLLIIGTDTPNTYHFLVFFDRDPRIGYQAIATAPVKRVDAVQASIPQKQPNSKGRAIYWLGCFLLWTICFLVGTRWGIKWELVPLFVLLLWVWIVPRRLIRPKETKHDT